MKGTGRKRRQPKEPSLPDMLARQAMAHYHTIDASSYRRLFTRKDGTLHTLDFKIDPDLRRILARRGLSRDDLLSIGVYAGAFHMATCLCDAIEKAKGKGAQG